jgi:hypothetical protein
MKWLGNTWVAALLLFVAMNVRGQDGVVVHSDPRLSLLVKTPHNMEPTAANITLHKTPKVTRVAAVTSVPSAKPAPNPLNASSSATTAKTAGATSPGVESSAPAPAKAAPVKISSAEASTTGHAGGWTPPVHRVPRTVYSGKGFRVQIYNGTDRNKAMEIKTEFMRNYPGMRTYLTYVSPCFRVKVGNYRTRNEALGMLKEASSMYTPCMIVPDLITISTF